MDDLFPETLGRSPDPIVFQSVDVVDKWGNPRVIVHLKPVWDKVSGYWYGSWFCFVEGTADEHIYGRPDHPNNCWYRPGTPFAARDYYVASGESARTVKLIMEQMLQSGYVDPSLADPVREIQWALESAAQNWLCK